MAIKTFSHAHRHRILVRVQIIALSKAHLANARLWLFHSFLRLLPLPELKLYSPMHVVGLYPRDFGAKHRVAGGLSHYADDECSIN